MHINARSCMCCQDVLCFSHLGNHIFTGVIAGSRFPVYGLGLRIHGRPWGQADILGAC